MKYNKDLHSSVVFNLRRFWKESGANVKLTLTDEEVWNLFEEWYLIELEPTPEYLPIIQKFGNDARYVVGMQEAMREKMEST